MYRDETSRERFAGYRWHTIFFYLLRRIGINESDFRVLPQFCFLSSDLAKKEKKKKIKKKKRYETLRVDCYYLNLCDCRQNTHIHTNDWLQINLFYIFNCLIISWHFRYPLSVHTRIAWIIQFSISYFHQHAYSNTFYLFLMIFGRKGIAQS